MTPARRRLASAAAYVLLTFPVAVVWHVVLLGDVYRDLGYFGKEPNFLLGFLAIATQAALLSCGFEAYRRGERPLREGLTYSFACGAFLWSSHVVATAAKVELSPLSTFVALETTYLLLQFLLYGLALGWLGRRGETTPARA